MRIDKVKPEERKEAIEVWRRGQARSFWYRLKGPLLPSKEDFEKDFIRRIENWKALALGAYEGGRMIGVITYTINGEKARIGHTEPVVMEENVEKEVGRELMVELKDRLQKLGVKEVSTVLRCEADGRASWHHGLYLSQGMQEIKKYILMGAPLSKVSLEQRPGIKLQIRGERSVEEFVEVIKQAFSATDFRWRTESDPLVVDLAWHKKLAEKTPPENWIMAIMKNEPAGVVISGLPEDFGETIGWPRVGVIGEIGVIKRFRRRGVGTTLLGAAHRRFIEQALDYTFLGTHFENFAAQALYQSVGCKRLYANEFFQGKLS